ncbi:MAG: DUF1592 domain-containing protein [Planctomycetota bacterium]|nr:DUF1592 domain-containing protein [Planctomycetota bacterium]
MNADWNTHRAGTGIVFVMFAIAALAEVTGGAAQNATSQDQSVEATERAYGSTILPLLRRYCFECHSGDRTEADIDLAEFTSVAMARKNVTAWLKVREMLDSNQMPPKDSRQATDVEHKSLQEWVRNFLTGEAKAHAGDPGPVVLRRLNNAEYNYTLQDLTGVASLDPTREFPVDGAAGEGFTNTGSAQSMSPSLVTKYLDAAKEVSEHAVLLPDGIRFSPTTSRRDHTDELLARIQAFYRNFTEEGGGSTVNLQGVKFDTNQGGLLAVGKYLAATLEERDALVSGRKTVASVARERSLNERYLQTLWHTLSTEAQPPGSLLIDGFRQKWHRSTIADTAALTAEIAQTQQTLWKFNPVGQLGEGGRQKMWMEAVAPIVSRQDLRLALPVVAGQSESIVYLAANDLSDGREQDFILWDRPRIEFKADTTGVVHSPILLRDLNGLVGRVQRTMASEVPRTATYLAAVLKLRSPDSSIDDLAKASGLNAQLLKRWAELVGLGHREKREITGHFTSKLPRAGGYDAVNGWGTSQTPNMLANRSDDDISFSTLTVPAHGVVMHPSPTQESLAAWRSPLDGQVFVEGLVADADHKCGNGAAWRVELLSDSGTTSLASGVFDNGGKQPFKAKGEIDVRAGDVVFLIVNARDKSHVCDTTHVELKLSEVGDEKRTWDLATDVVSRILEANPLPDSYGHSETWHFGATGNKPATTSVMIPGSMLARWRAAVLDARPSDEISRLASSVQSVVTSKAVATLSDPDQKLRDQLTDWKGPLRWAMSSAGTATVENSEFGVDPAVFGKHPNGSPIEASSLCVQAPQILEVRLPAALVSGAEFVVSGELHAATGNAGSVQVQLLTTKPETLLMSPSLPILVREGGAAHRRLEVAMTEFRNLFPAALCYARIVPVDEVVTMTLFFREDDHLKRLMLNNGQAAELDRLWDELFYVAQEPIALTVAFEQIYEFATQDRPDLVKVFGPMRKPINDRANVFRQRLVNTEPAHLADVIDFADRAWRRPLSGDDIEDLTDFYNQLRSSEITHEASIRLTLARILTSPAFLYRREVQPKGTASLPVIGYELASRLSYFLWSSMPDSELIDASDGHSLREDNILKKQTARMLQDPRTRRLAIQFACQWLHLRDFDKNDDKNEKLYPEFAALRGEMYEETVRFFEDMFRHDGSVLGLLNADHTFLNESLAKHYGIENISGGHWRRVEGIQKKGRGGILGMATVLASQSGASRTSPILRGNWIYETLLGERLPRPPATVPQLPESVPTGLTARQLIEQHSSAPSCANCHERIDPYGFALEQFDAIGRLRKTAVDTKTTLTEGQAIEGLNGLRDYLLTERRDDVVRQFCRKLLGFALGREVQLSDELLLAEMVRKLEVNQYRFSVAVETIVLSEQFRRVRGKDFSDE